jgi:peptidoglycan/xylan/chitin deacetylase (PgdA/CDA1 family)
MKIAKKKVLQRAFSLLGVTPARWRFLPPRLYCFNFHRVGDAGSTDYSRNVFSCTAARFEEHVALLRDKFDILNLERLSRLDPAKIGRKPPALLTFDDGYLDNYQTAFPILRRHGVTAVFFIPTGFIDSTQLPWWEEIPWVLRRAGGTTIRLRGAAEPFTLCANDGERSIRRVMTFVKSRPIPAEEQLEEIRSVCGGVRPPVDGPGERLFVNWTELKEMAAAGMDIGSHTHTHRLLAHLSPAEQRQELGRSKEILEGRLGAPVSSVAYPIGSRVAYSAETCSIAASLGYRWGFNFLRRANELPISNPLDIDRFAVSENPDRSTLRAQVCFPRLFA